MQLAVTRPSPCLDAARGLLRPSSAPAHTKKQLFEVHFYTRTRQARRLRALRTEGQERAQQWGRVAFRRPAMGQSGVREGWGRRWCAPLAVHNQSQPLARPPPRRDAIKGGARERRDRAKDVAGKKAYTHTTHTPNGWKCCLTGTVVYRTREQRRAAFCWMGERDRRREKEEI